MPTGYTWKVANGELTDFNQFVLDCARAMGACVTMRDEPSDTPIPEEFQPSTYDKEQAAASRAELERLSSLTIEQILAEATASHQEALKDYKERLTEYFAVDQRLLAMQEKVKAWRPPSEDHTQFKEFMLEQLRISLNGDMKQYMVKPKEQLASDWFEQRKKSLQEDIEYHEKEQLKENDRVAKRNLWLKQLRQSLAEE